MNLMNSSSNARSNLQIFVIALVAGLAVWLTITYARLIMEVFALLFGAFLISLALRPLAGWLHRWRIPRGVTVLGVYLLVIVLLGVIGGFTGSAINSQIILLRETGPLLVQEAISRLETIPLVHQLFPSLDTLSQNLSQGIGSVVSAVFDAASGVSRIFIDIIIVAILAFFFATDRNLGQNLLNTWVPTRYRQRVNAVISNATKRLSRWIGAQLIVILFFSTAYGVGLLIIGVPFALIIAIVGGVLEIIPFVGGLTALILSILAALTVRPVLIIWVLILYVVVTQVEANIIQPNLYGRMVDVHPVAVLIALFIGATAGGIFGALFAIPVVVVLTAILAEFQVDQPVPDQSGGGTPASG